MTNLLSNRTILSASVLLGLGVSGCAVDVQSAAEAEGSSAQALVTGDTGFVWAQSPTGSFDASTPYSLNSTGGVNHITQLGTGSYRVDFPGLGSVIGGDVQVTAYGSTSERCKVSGWGSAGTVLQAYLLCFTSAGAPTNTQFTASYQRRSGILGAEGGYVWADQPSTPSYTPSPTYQWNSAGGSVTILRSSAGSYAVTFPGQNFVGGTVEVTAYGTGSEYCKVGSWGPSGANQNVFVQCFSTAGVLTDTRFTAVFSRRSPNNVASYTYAWANQPSSTVNYIPSTTYQFGSIASECGDHPTTSPVNISRTSTGQYTVHFPGMTTSFARSNVKVTGYGYGSDTCKVVGWFNETGGAVANVACFGATGSLLDSFYTITFSTTLAIVC